MNEFTLPDLGEGIEAGDVVQVLVAEGDVIARDQPVVEIETDKAVVDVPCPFAGRVVKVHVRAGDRVKVGAPLVSIDGEREAAAAGAVTAAGGPPAEVPPGAPEANLPEKAQAPTPTREELAPAAAREPAAPVVPASPITPGPAEEPVPAGPATRRLARELGVDLRAVAAAHPGVRLTEESVKAYVRQTQAAAGPGMDVPAAAGLGTRGPAAGPIKAPPLPDFTQWGPVERVPLTSVQRKTAEHMAAAWAFAPRVTQFDEADITALEALRRRHRETEKGRQARLTVTAFVLKAAALALKAHPQFNASLDVDAGELILKRYCHIGMAVDTPAGLIVPVVRDVDRKRVLEIAAEMNDLAERTRQRKIGLDELRGATFTVTNLGGLGGTAFTPIVNYPEVAVLGLARSREVPVVRDGQITPRLVLPLCLSYDHRVINGADGVRFLRKIAGLLEDPELLLLEA